VGKCLGEMEKIASHFDHENRIPSESGKHARKSVKEDCAKIVEQLNKMEVFCPMPGRKHAKTHVVLIIVMYIVTLHPCKFNCNNNYLILTLWSCDITELWITYITRIQTNITATARASEQNFIFMVKVL